ncbi:DUF4856 domain-containing protein [Flavobacterium gawalongense]|uniref:DUF4856 domain-containing protein n=1 Tax=Flavobacterium gawalongense TaxID=2594432 RepID=A0A553BYQ9_9FLAO|nr:DUF4856 domain-containing protein [Flavobacterium gawalongense]TRX04526.1 DUF4856 domain-containing protein [Flavobacterium gawalongense]TRX10413.1 DUF4856 domain-containing protein [Flavobacterium gawalongense]TRX13462.1 DUF4856 domain-containing protein [Flavobacterium gawalongense]TRX15606.1 DUF4856 domain-containing protein [Flavobacterium gawalongense]TRX31444.1 DUF4856 domain-containing protein [Flavobacterium gawalongense]
MEFKKLSLSALSILVLSLASCSNDDTPAEETFNYTVPETYTFERNALTSVDYSGQSSRLLMLDEMSAYVKTQAISSLAVDNVKLQSMYTNTNSAFAGAGLNTSGKQLKDKTAASKDYFSLYLGGGSIAEQTAVRAYFESTFTDLNSASQGANASAGVAGKYGTGSSTRYFKANGLEPVQVFLKGTMGATFLDQVVNNYLSLNKLDESTNKADNTAKVLVTGKSYTAMEHTWDEAYGYVFGATGDKFLSEYITKVNADVDFNTVKNDISLAFRKGRAAIVANDYATRDAQIKIIKEKLALVVAVRSVFYMQTGKAKLVTDNGAAAFHDLSEGYGFIMSLRYTNKPGTNSPYFTKAEVDAMLASLTSGTNGLWAIDTLGAKLDAISIQIATKFGFTVAQAATVN